MKLSHLKVYLTVCMLVSMVVIPAFSQDAGNAPAQEAQAAPAPITDVTPQTKEIAIYGEVQAVDASANTLSVQYYDYDSDSEKTAAIAINPDTKLENASAIGDIKKGDWVDVTYVVKDGKNTAKVVTVEKEETPAPDEASSQAALPANVPPEQ
ncbi:MAG: DUF5666 domain-containing protein [Candidatus Omnitrophica bacterium]|nr:DUF5666 domain-containing protein [Candidatus Omnitrophota bacterium]